MLMHHTYHTYHHIINIEEDGILVKTYWKGDFIKAEKTEKKKMQRFHFTTV